MPNKCQKSGWVGITLKAEVITTLASQAPSFFDLGNGMVNVMVVERKFFERNKAVNAWKRGIMQ